MNPRIGDVFLITVAIAAFGVAGAMDMNDQIEMSKPRALDCRDKLNLRKAQTADEASGRCDQPEGTTK